MNTRVKQEAPSTARSGLSLQVKDEDDDDENVHGNAKSSRNSRKSQGKKRNYDEDSSYSEDYDDDDIEGGLGGSIADDDDDDDLLILASTGGRFDKDDAGHAGERVGVPATAARLRRQQRRAAEMLTDDTDENYFLERTRGPKAGRPPPGYVAPAAETATSTGVDQLRRVNQSTGMNDNDDDDDDSTKAPELWRMAEPRAPISHAGAPPLGSPQPHDVLLPELLSPSQGPSGRGRGRGGLVVPGPLWGALLPHQRQGLAWAWERHQRGEGGVIADEMGLGKTVQVAALLNSLEYSAHVGVRPVRLRPSLVVCPATLMSQWLLELRLWAPQLRVVVFHESSHSSSGGAGMDAALRAANRAVAHNGTHAVVITSYDMVLRRAADLHALDWSYLILDEGHKIRNPAAKITAAVKSFRTARRLVLTGSPVQNSLRELWSIVDFAVPDRLGALEVFESEYSDPINAGRYANASETTVRRAVKLGRDLRATLAPLLLQRLKREVQLRLPGKTEDVVYCGLTRAQWEVYTAHINGEEVQMLLGDEAARVAAKRDKALRNAVEGVASKAAASKGGSAALESGAVVPGNRPFAQRAAAAAEAEAEAEATASDMIVGVAAIDRENGIVHPRTDDNDELASLLDSAPQRTTRIASADDPTVRADAAFTGLSSARWDDRKTLRGHVRHRHEQLRSRAGTGLGGGSQWGGAGASDVGGLGRVLSSITLLRKVCNHSDLAIVGVEAEKQDKAARAAQAARKLAKQQAQARGEETYELGGGGSYRLGQGTGNRVVSLTPSTGAPTSKGAKRAAGAVGGGGKRSKLSRGNSNPWAVKTAGDMSDDNDDGDEEEEEEEDDDVVTVRSQRIARIPDYGNPERSGKLLVLLHLLQQWRPQGHRALVFTQSRQTLDIVESAVVAAGHSCLRLDGQTPVRARIPLVARFNSDPSINVFLLTTKAGGLGINLTGADRVVAFDPDWNPATDAQAQDRAYRIGQRKPVKVYSLVTKGTIEEKVLHRQLFKKVLAASVVKTNAISSLSGSNSASSQVAAAKELARLRSSMTKDALHDLFGAPPPPLSAQAIARMRIAEQSAALASAEPASAPPASAAAAAAAAAAAGAAAGAVAVKDLLGSARANGGDSPVGVDVVSRAAAEGTEAEAAAAAAAAAAAPKTEAELVRALLQERAAAAAATASSANSQAASGVTTGNESIFARVMQLEDTSDAAAASVGLSGFGIASVAAVADSAARQAVLDARRRLEESVRLRREVAAARAAARDQAAVREAIKRGHPNPASVAGKEALALVRKQEALKAQIAHRQKLQAAGGSGSTGAGVHGAHKALRPPSPLPGAVGMRPAAPRKGSPVPGSVLSPVAATAAAAAAVAAARVARATGASTSARASDPLSVISAPNGLPSSLGGSAAFVASPQTSSRPRVSLAQTHLPPAPAAAAAGSNGSAAKTDHVRRQLAEKALGGGAALESAIAAAVEDLRREEAAKAAPVGAAAKASAAKAAAEDAQRASSAQAAMAAARAAAAAASAAAAGVDVNAVREEIQRGRGGDQSLLGLGVVMLPPNSAAGPGTEDKAARIAAAAASAELEPLSRVAADVAAGRPLHAADAPLHFSGWPLPGGGARGRMPGYGAPLAAAPMRDAPLSAATSAHVPASAFSARPAPPPTSAPATAADAGGARALLHRMRMQALRDSRTAAGRSPTADEEENPDEW